jgi:ferredoxin-type protein NapH
MLKITRLKLVVQIILVFIIVYLGYLGVRMIEWHKISLVLPTLSCHYLKERVASCYIYTIQELLNSGFKVRYTNLIIPTIVFLLLGLIFGRAWCSWACPIGFLQDMFTRLRSFLKIGHYNLSDDLKLVSVFVKWFTVLGLISISLGIGIPHFFMKAFQYDLILPFCQLCPGKQIYPLLTARFKEVLAVDTITQLTAVMSYAAIVSFVFYLVTTAFIRRMWCRLCPMGVLLGFLNKISLLSLRKEGKRCTKCGICQRSCPVQVSEVYEEKTRERIDPSDCTLCFRCVEMCPEKNALKASFLKFPLAVSKYRRFLHSNAVKVTSGKKEKSL